MPKDPHSSGKPKVNAPQGPSKGSPPSSGATKYTPPAPRQPVSKPLSQPPASPPAGVNPPPVGGWLLQIRLLSV
jgi:hypothetical protein